MKKRFPYSLGVSSENNASFFIPYAWQAVMVLWSAHRGYAHTETVAATVAVYQRSQRRLHYSSSFSFFIPTYRENILKTALAHGGEVRPRSTDASAVELESSTTSSQQFPCGTMTEFCPTERLVLGSAQRKSRDYLRFHFTRAQLLQKDSSSRLSAGNTAIQTAQPNVKDTTRPGLNTCCQ